MPFLQQGRSSLILPSAKMKYSIIAQFSDDTPGKFISRSRAAYLLRAGRSRSPRNIQRLSYAENLLDGYLVKDSSVIIKTIPV